MEPELKIPVQRTPRVSAPLQHDRFDGAHDGYTDRFSHMYEFSSLRAPGNTGRNTLIRWYAKGCQFVKTHSDATFMRRTKTHAQNGEGLVLVRRFHNSRSRATMGDTALVLEPGRLYLSDEGVPVDSYKPADRMDGIILPKRLLGYQSGIHAPFIDLSRCPVLATALHLEFDHIFEHLSAHDALDQDAFARLIACLQQAIGSPQQAGDVRRTARAAMADAIRVSIERHLDAPDMSVGWILKRFGVSRASLYRMFEGDGGVRQYVSDRRLYRAVLDLTERPLRRGDIAAASEKWGFTSDRDFNRAVKRAFGVAPGSLVNTARQGAR